MAMPAWFDFRRTVVDDDKSYLMPLLIIGGNGGDSFRFIGEDIGATLKKIQVWVGWYHVKAVKVWLTDGQSQQFGIPGGKFYEFQLEDGECISSLSLWSNGRWPDCRLGAIKFETTCSKKFFASMLNQELIREYQVDVGTGICLGVVGRSGHDIDNLGFVFVSTISSAVLTNVSSAVLTNITYPTLHDVIPQVATEEIKSLTYTNDTDVTQSFTVETSKTIIKTSKWSVSGKLEITFNLEVKAGIPFISEGSAGFGLTLGVEGSYGLENSEEKKETFTFPVQIPARKTVVIDVTIGRATVELPYTGTVEVTCHSGGVLRLNTRGIYKGVAYTNAKTTVTQK